LLAVVGGGGAILTLPILVYGFGLDPWTATTYSLFIVGFTASIGAIRHARERRIDYAAAIRFALPALIALHLVRALVVPNIPASFTMPVIGVVTKDILIMTLLATAMLASAYSMLRNCPRNTDSLPTSNTSNTSNTSAAFFRSVGRGFGVGLFTGIVGAGGGFLLVPALSMVERLPLKRAVATSLLVIAVNSLLGFTGDIIRGVGIDWRLLLGFSAMAGLGMLGGTSLTRSLNDRHVRTVFGSTLVAIAVLMIGLEVKGR
jgi:uncharacterized protein